MRLFGIVWSSTLKYPVVFISKILVFSLLYWLIFSISPDSFRFANGYNVEPLANYWETFYERDDPAEIAESDLATDIEKFRSQAQLLNKAYLSWQSDREAREAADRFDQDLAHQMSDLADENARKYEEELVEPLEKRIRELELKNQTGSLDPFEEVALLEEILSLRKEILVRFNRILHNRMSFIPENLVQEKAAASELLSHAIEKENSSAVLYRDLRSKLADVYSKTRAAARDKIGFLDFLYFSVCISTTTTFGDIVANNQYLRVVVAFQIIIGIIILSGLLQSSLSARSRPRTAISNEGNTLQ